MVNPHVVAVSRSSEHSFSKPNRSMIRLIEGFGVEGDAHAGKTVKHRYLVKQDPARPNLRQVHLITAELLDELGARGYSIEPGQLGENITTSGLDLLSMPTGVKLHIGEVAVIQLTALRNPCHQIDKLQKGLLAAVLDQDEEGNVLRKAGVMAVVLAGGEIRPGDKIVVVRPPEPHRQLEYVW